MEYLMIQLLSLFRYRENIENSFKIIKLIPFLCINKSNSDKHFERNVLYFDQHYTK